MKVAPAARGMIKEQLRVPEVINQHQPQSHVTAVHSVHVKGAAVDRLNRQEAAGLQIQLGLPVVAFAFLQQGDAGCAKLGQSDADSTGIRPHIRQRLACDGAGYPPGDLCALLPGMPSSRREDAVSEIQRLEPGTKVRDALGHEHIYSPVICEDSHRAALPRRSPPDRWFVRSSGMSARDRQRVRAGSGGLNSLRPYGKHEGSCGENCAGIPGTPFSTNTKPCRNSAWRPVPRSSRPDKDARPRAAPLVSGRLRVPTAKTPHAGCAEMRKRWSIHLDEPVPCSTWSATAREDGCSAACAGNAGTARRRWPACTGGPANERVSCSDGDRPSRPGAAPVAGRPRTGDHAACAQRCPAAGVWPSARRDAEP